MASAPVYLEASGRVVEVFPPYKAVVEFKCEGKPARALLKFEKIPYENKPKDTPKSISDLVQVGSIATFSCHTFDEHREDRCGWFIAEVYSIHKTEYDVALFSNIALCPTVISEKGRILSLDDRQGTLYFVKNEITYDAMFMANNFYLHQIKYPAKKSLKAHLNIDDYVYFDAVPTDPVENDLHCSWFATLVWQGSRPDVSPLEKPIKENDATLNTIKTGDLTGPNVTQADVKQGAFLKFVNMNRSNANWCFQITKNPRSGFLRGRGQIMQILNEEYGVILGAVNEKQTHWQSILFHRSKSSLFKLKLSRGDLRSIFRPGDRVRFIAVRAPRNFTTEWVASQVTLDYDEDALRGL